MGRVGWTDPTSAPQKSGEQFQDMAPQKRGAPGVAGRNVAPRLVGQHRPKTAPTQSD